MQPKENSCVTYMDIIRKSVGEVDVQQLFYKGVEQGEKAIEQDLKNLEERNMRVEIDVTLIEPNGMAEYHQGA